MAYAKANPGKLNYASAGIGNTIHLAGELFNVAAGVKIVHVPYNSGAEATTAVLGGQVQMTFVNITGLPPLIADGKLRALAVTSPKRLALLPDVPTMVESGYPDFVVRAFFGLVAPAGTPTPVVDKLNATINAGMTSNEMQPRSRGSAPNQVRAPRPSSPRSSPPSGSDGRRSPKLPISASTKRDPTRHAKTVGNGRTTVTGRRMLAAMAASLMTVLAASAATAQSYPTRTVKIVSPFPPGGPTEFVQRLIADRLQSTLGQPFVIENRSGGAGGTVGAKSVATAEPDGYTLLFSSPGPLVTAAAIYRKLDYDPVRSFAPIAMTLMAPQMLVVHPSVPAKTMAELVAYAKKHPGDLKFASSGYGTQPHMLGEMLRLAAGIDIAHVPYRGAGQSVTDVTAGQVPMIFEATSVLMSHVQSGRLRALAICTEERSKLLPRSRRPAKPATRHCWRASGQASWRPPARRKRSSASSMRRSTTSCVRRRRRPAWRG